MTNWLLRVAVAYVYLRTWKFPLHTKTTITLASELTQDLANIFIVISQPRY